jgi:hypothetical protein
VTLVVTVVLLLGSVAGVALWSRSQLMPIGAMRDTHGRSPEPAPAVTDAPATAAGDPLPAEAPGAQVSGQGRVAADPGPLEAPRERTSPDDGIGSTSSPPEVAPPPAPRLAVSPVPPQPEPVTRATPVTPPPAPEPRPQPRAPVAPPPALPERSSTRAVARLMPSAPQAPPPALPLPGSPSALASPRRLGTGSGDLRVDVSAEALPAGATAYTVRIRERTGTPVTDASVTIRGRRPDGMLVDAALDPMPEPGVYRAVVRVSDVMDPRLRVARAGVIQDVALPE